MEWLQNMDWLQLLRCFCTGGIICVIGQILIDKTKDAGGLTSSALFKLQFND